jgi:IS605 OrfB family transposase
MPKDTCWLALAGPDCEPFCGHLQITSQLARSKQAVVIEDLAVGGMLKSRRFGRGLADQALASLRRQLEYKCPASGCRLGGAALLVEIGAQLRRPALVS